MKRPDRLRKCLSALTILLGAALCAAAVILLVKGAAARAADPGAPVFTREGTGRALFYLLPLFILWLAAWAAAVLTGVRAGLAGPKVRKIPAVPLPERKGTPPVRAALLILAAGLIVLGILNGGLNDVFVKAVRICTECIGLG